MHIKLSIIVPVYNVEKYIHRCIDSILEQTFTDFELILVDDGSLDNSGRICNGYAGFDSRIKVIHKKNGGLSSARNAGLDIAQGEYIGFVDSDDWIEKDMYESLYNAMLKYDADVTICGRFVVKRDEITAISDSEEVQVFNRFEALYELILDDINKINNFAWDKLYKKELFKDIRFPEGRYFEDIFTAYKILLAANKIVHIKSPKYYYFQREDSICRLLTFKKSYDIYLGWSECLTNVKRFYPLLSEICNEKIVNKQYSCLCSMLTSIDKDEHLCEINEVSLELRENYFYLRHRGNLDIKIRLWMILSSINLNLCYKIYLQYKSFGIISKLKIWL
ncbi:MAG: glycosyltransferase [Bacillota bacterium]|nr:glycosyltransferase [Bacillota bacterium]